MKRPLPLALLVILLLLPFAAALAAPQPQQARPVIAQPAPDSAVRGMVQIVGTATDSQFQRYELYYAPWPVPSDQSWIFIGDAHYNQQPLGLLGTWDSRSVPDGAYGLRVRVVKLDGNYVDSDARRVLVVNTRPEPSPTPINSPTPEPLPTEPPPTPTIMVAVPTVALSPSPAATATPEPETTPLLPAAPSTTSTGSSAGAIAGQLFSGQRLLDVAEKATLYTLGAFAAIGLFFAVKALLVWLWYKIRP